MRLAPELAPVFVRAHTRVKRKRRRREREWTHPKAWANFALVFDCETTTDLREDLNFLWWRFCELKDGAYVCQREGIVYRDNLDAKSFDLIHQFVRGKRADVEDGCPEEILVQSRTQFANGEFWNALRAGAVIVNFNAPFDLSRLALAFPEAKSKNTGWAMELWKYRGQREKFKPKLRIKPKDSRSAFISLAGGDPNNRLIYRGRFLDLSVLGWALRNKHLDLNGFLRSFGLRPKMSHEPTGRVTRRELAYGRRDTERTVALLNAMKREYDGFRLKKLAPEHAMSAASITKVFLDDMHITEPAKKFQLPDAVLGKCMQAYYGGRSEIRIRHQEVPVVVCDTTSEYPSVAALLNLWPVLTAAKLTVVDCTAVARELLGRVSSRTLLNPATWKELAFFASIEADGDILPVRALYGESGDTNIGVNPLTSAQPIWYAGPDLAASTLCAEINHLNPYDPTRVTDILKIEECNYDRAGNQHQLYGLAVSAKRYVVYTRRRPKVTIIKPSEHGLGIVFVPDKRKRYKPVDSICRKWSSRSLAQASTTHRAYTLSRSLHDGGKLGKP